MRDSVQIESKVTKDSDVDAEKSVEVQSYNEDSRNLSLRQRKFSGNNSSNDQPRGTAGFGPEAFRPGSDLQT